jgi:hypothetical protein
MGAPAAIDNLDAARVEAATELLREQRAQGVE